MMLHFTREGSPFSRTSATIGDRRLPAVSRRHVLLTMICAAAFVQVAGSMLVAGEKTIEPREAVRILRKAEAQWTSYKWKFRRERLVAASPKADTPAALRLKPVAPDDWTFGAYSSGVSFYDTRKGLYLVEMESVSPWFNGAADFISAVEGASFDGKRHLHWKRIKHGKVPPLLVDIKVQEKVPRQLRPPVTTGPLEATAQTAKEGRKWLEIYSGNTGLLFLPPHVFSYDNEDHRLMSLAELIEHRLKMGESVSVRERESGLWQIEMIGHSTKGLIRFYPDPNRGFAMTRAEWFDGSVSPAVEYQRLLYELTEVEKGLWFPKTVVEVNLINSLANTYKFTEIEIDPSPKDEKFHEDFLKWALVDELVDGDFRYDAGAEDGDETDGKSPN